MNVDNIVWLFFGAPAILIVTGCLLSDWRDRKKRAK